MLIITMRHSRTNVVQPKIKIMTIQTFIMRIHKFNRIDTK